MSAFRSLCFARNLTSDFVANLWLRLLRKLKKRGMMFSSLREATFSLLVCRAFCAFYVFAVVGILRVFVLDVVGDVVCVKEGLGRGELE